MHNLPSVPARPLCSWTHLVNTEGAKERDWLVSTEYIIFPPQLFMSSSVMLLLCEHLHDTNTSQILLICKGVSIQILSRLPHHQYTIMFFSKFLTIWPNHLVLYMNQHRSIPLAMPPPRQNPSTSLEIMPTERILFHHFFFFVWKSLRDHKYMLRRRRKYSLSIRHGYLGHYSWVCQCLQDLIKPYIIDTFSILS